MHELRFALPTMQMAALSNVASINAQSISASSPLVICLHGYLDNANSFLPILPLLSQHQCIAIDMAGHGASSHRPVGAHYHLSDYAYDLYQLIESQGFSHVVLVGHSLGGIVSSIYASTQASQVLGYIAIESIGPLSQSEETTSEQLRDCFASRNKALGPIKQPKNLQDLVRARSAISDLSDKNAEIILRRNVIEGSRDAEQLSNDATSRTSQLMWRTDKNLRTQSPYRMSEAQARNVLDNIRCPRGLILGEQGFAKIKQALKQRVAQFGKVPVAVFPGGHHVHMESAQCVAEQINKWLDDFT